MTKSYLTWLRAATAASLVVFTAACGDDSPTGPNGPSGDPFDPEQSNQEFGAFQGAFDANADLAAEIAVVTAALDTLAPTGSARLYQPVDVPAEPAMLRVIRTTRFSGSSAGSAQPLLPADVLGKTFEWDETENGYVASEATGAPANGVRFVIYDRTSVPFVANGFLDVTDDSDAAADRVGVHMEKDGVVRLDYDIAATQTTSSLSVSVAGYVSDGTQRVDFDVTETATETVDGFRVNLDYGLSLAGQPISVDYAFVINFGETLTADIVATFVNGVNELVIDLSQAGDGSLTGSVEWNGALVMTVTDDGNGEPVFLGAGGDPVTPEEAVAIQQMFELAEEAVFFLVSNLFFLGSSLS
ncbi:MAG: hypothetical protein ACR2GQ_08515 [Gemmatimonadota bacterium]